MKIPSAVLVALGITISLAGSMASSQQAQVEHAPTVEQCRADRDLWSYELFTNASENELHARLSHIPFNTLEIRAHELNVCEVAIDARATFKNERDEIDFWKNFSIYNALEHRYSGEIKLRFGMFIEKNNLTAMFLKDADSQVPK